MIKLRAWCEDHKEMYFADKEYVFQIHDSRIVYRPIRNVNDFNFFTDKPHFEDEIGIIVEQFTGLVDRNGKDIYEGDILKYGAFVYVVRWDKRKALFGIFFPDNDILVSYPFSDPEKYELVGNIHQNPELL